MGSQFVANKIKSGKMRALNDANIIKIKNTLEKGQIPDNLGHIRQMINMYELSITEKWKSFESYDEKEKNEFKTMCIECFTLLQALEIPAEPIPKIIHALKMFTYGYIGEKGESVSRLLSEDKFMVNDSSEWNIRVFITIYKGILSMVQKKNKQYLQNTANLIQQLRDEQSKYEKTYLNTSQKGAVYELASLYHLSKATDITSTYLLQGLPPQAETLLDIHFERAIDFAQKCGLLELDLLLHMLQVSFKKMVTNSIWFEAKHIPGIEKLLKTLADAPKPVFELMYPQRTAIQNGLLDQFNNMMVVTLPTSSGKTMIAEFKILQVQSQRGKDFWIAYVVPTRALVNQITSGLRRDFDGLGIRVEKMSGALEQNKFEESLINSREFDVLVTTPEKLNLLLRQDSQAGQKSKLCNSLALTVIDEAHNIGNPKRGLALEMLISIIKNDCIHASLLLLTPRMPDAKDVAKWLDPENPKDISMQLDWVPNDSVVGAFYPKGAKRDISTQFKPILYSGSDFEMNEICLGSESHSMDTFNNIRNTKYMRTVYAAHHMVGRGNVLVVANDVKTSWNIARKLSELMRTSEQDDDIDLVKKFVKAELGETFELVKYLDYRIGVHNAGLPDDILKLLEWLMENGKLKILVSTTTIAQGVNFPASTILLPTYYLKNQSDIKAGSKKMTAIDFMNIAGRVGRTHQSIGIVGISTDGTNVDLEKLKSFLKKDVEKIFSALYKLCDTVMKQNRQFNLSAFANEPGWSNFIQYLAHMYNQSSNLDDFIMRAEIILRNTYGYIQMNKQTQIQLLKAVKEYGSELDNNPKVSIMSDNTGFSPNTVESAVQKIKNENIVLDKSLFSGSSETLTKLIHIMRNDIPELDWTDTSHKNRFSDDDLNKIMTAWVAGDKIYEISEKYFGGTDTDSVRGCITTIYKKIVNYATWGLSAVEKISENTTNIPARVHYGVNSDEAILMSMNGVPRRIAEGLGKTYFENKASLYDARSPDVLKWLQSKNSAWDKASDGALTGQEYKKIWQINEGLSK